MVRLVARMDVKGENLIKGVQLEGLRVIGTVKEYSKKYYEMGADEIVYMDCVASLYGRNKLKDILKEAVSEVYCPVTVGGGIRTLEDAHDIFRAGADKIAINTAAISNPDLITQISNKFGRQAVVLSIEAKKIGDCWFAYTDNGRERSSLNVIDWARQGVRLGAGEVLLTSVDREGTRRGFDTQLVRTVSEAVDVPVIASGGMGQLEDAVSIVIEGKADAIAFADVIHYGRFDIQQIRKFLLDNSIKVREYEIQQCRGN